MCGFQLSAGREPGRQNLTDCGGAMIYWLSRIRRSRRTREIPKISMSLLAAFCWSALACASFARAGDLPAETNALQRILDAKAAAEHKDWPAEIDLLSQVTAQSPDNGQFRLMLARARFNAGDYAAAAADYEKALALNAFDPAILNYGIAQCWALEKNPEAALHWLKAAMALGYRNLDAARENDVFSALHGNPEFDALLGIIDPSSLSRDAGWRYDIKFLADWVEKKSFHPFRTETADRNLSAARYTRQEFDAAVASLAADVPTLGDRRIELELFRLVAALGDGHTEIGGSRRRLEFATSLPLGFYVFDDGLYVISAAPAHRDVLGAKVLAFDGVPTQEVVEKIDDLIARDNPMWLKAMEPQFLRHVPFLQELGIAREDGAVALSVLGSDGQSRVVRVVADPTQPDIWNLVPKPEGWIWLGDASKADYQRDNDRPYWSRWDPVSKILYVQYNKIVDGERQSLADFARELADTLERQPVDKLVIDMRNNNGGDTFLNEALLKVVIAARKLSEPGRLYVIIGRRTFSAAMNAVSYFARFTNAVFVGEPTGGKPNAPGDETFLTLPYSGILVNLSDRYWQSSWPQDFSPWRAPDIAVPVTFADYAAGRDAAMAVIEAQPLPR
jgi:tetratricopeptide (TPR) repeat protein